MKLQKKEGRPASAGYHGIFSTHPSTEKRIVAMNQTESKVGIKNKEEFLKMIDGLPYGTSDDEGYTRYNVFYHPFFAIKFTFPEGWDLENLPKKLIIRNDSAVVTMISDNLLRDDIDNGLSPKDYLNQNINKTSFLSKNTLIDDKSINNNMIPGHTYLYETTSLSSKSYTRYSVFFDIEQKDKKPKAWIFIKKFKNIRDDDESNIIDNSFAKMTEEEVAKASGLRIKVIRFRDGMTYEKLANNSPLGRYAEGKLRLLNGHYPEGKPQIGDLIKIVE